MSLAVFQSLHLFVLASAFRSASDGKVKPGQGCYAPVLDVMQTFSFVYLIPVVMLLGIGKVPGLILLCIYAVPLIVRLTNLGSRLVDEEVLGLLMRLVQIINSGFGAFEAALNQIFRWH